MTSLWRYPPGTLRALLATFKEQYVICRPCRRYTPMRVATKDLDRKYDPCPFRCDICKQRGRSAARSCSAYRRASAWSARISGRQRIGRRSSQAARSG